MILTRQDWRVERNDGWSDGHLGFWEVEVAAAGSYEVRLRFGPQETAGRAEFQLGSNKRTKAFTRGAESLTFTGIDLEAGPTRLRARLIRDGKTVGVRYADVTKLD